MNRILIVGTGLIGASVGLALKAAGFEGEVVGSGPNAETLKIARDRDAIDSWCTSVDADSIAAESDTILLAGPVLAIEDWMQRLASVLDEHQFVTDVGSTKREIAELAKRLFNQPGKARFLPGHPMAGKESGGASLAEATLFQNAMWLFTPIAEEEPLEKEWRGWVAKFGARTMDLDPARHDELCAWVSHLPQMVSTAMSALLEDIFGKDEAGRNELNAIGGRALREMTRLGASPYSMWRDIALTNAEPIATTLHALEQRIAHLRENLKTPELREEFTRANEFRKHHY